MPREEYLRWTGEWVRRAAARLTGAGALFLNAGAKPTDPWTAFDVAQAARPYLRLQNTNTVFVGVVALGLPPPTLTMGALLVVVTAVIIPALAVTVDYRNTVRA
jgi:hypothetical protein